MHECVDGEYQAFRAKDGAYIRKEFFGKYPELLKLVEHMSDDEIWALRRGGHDPVKVFNAYKRAMETKGQPTVILAKTVKGYGLGETAEGRMTRASAEEAGRCRSDEDSRPLRISAFRRSRRRTSTSSARRKTRRRCSTCGSASRRMGGPLPARKVKPIEIQAPPLEAVPRCAGRLARPRGFHHRRRSSAS